MTPELLITVDTEEDNQWDLFHRKNLTTDNILHMGELHDILMKDHFFPTYLVTYGVANQPPAVESLKSLADLKKCEIGAHLHAWSTPPLGPAHDADVVAARQQHLLSPSLEEEKLKHLTQKIKSTLKVTPRTFRAGRWAITERSAGFLLKNGYHTDTSVTPFTSWTAENGVDSSMYAPRPFYYPPLENVPIQNLKEKQILELPVTIGYNFAQLQRAHAVYTRLNSFPFSSLKCYSILRRLGIFKKIWLSPEKNTFQEMKTLVKLALKQQITPLNMAIHSSSYYIGSPHAPTDTAREKLISRTRQILKYLSSCNVVGTTPEHYYCSQLKLE